MHSVAFLWTLRASHITWGLPICLSVISGMKGKGQRLHFSYLLLMGGMAPGTVHACLSVCWQILTDEIQGAIKAYLTAFTKPSFISWPDIILLIQNNPEYFVISHDTCSKSPRTLGLRTATAPGRKLWGEGRGAPGNGSNACIFHTYPFPVAPGTHFRAASGLPPSLVFTSLEQLSARLISHLQKPPSPSHWLPMGDTYLGEFPASSKTVVLKPPYTLGSLENIQRYFSAAAFHRFWLDQCVEGPSVPKFTWL